MPDETRSSPWAPVSATPPVSGASEAPASAQEDPANPRRASVLSPFFIPREEGVAAPTPAMPAPSDFAPAAPAAPAAPTDPAQAWAPNRPIPLDSVDTMGAVQSSTGSWSKPAQPIVAGRGLVPEPVEVDEPEVIRPVAAPPASEILPVTGATPVVPTPAGMVPSLEPLSPEPEVTPDPVRMLGASAVTTASLSAAGGRAPSGTNVGSPLEVPNFGDQAPFVPRFEPVSAPGQPLVPGAATSPSQPTPPARSPLDMLAPVPTAPTDDPFAEIEALASNRPARPDVDAPPPTRVPQPVRNPALNPALGAPAISAAMRTELDAQGAEESSDDQATTILPAADGPPTLVGTPLVPPGSALTATSGIPVVPPGTPDAAEGDRPRRRFLWLWIVLAVVVVAGASALVYRLFFLPEPIILPAPVVTEAAPTPTIEPVALVDPTPFLAGLPAEISTFVMTSYEVVEVVGDTSLPVRAAEHVIVTYGESTGDEHFTLDAYQFYNEDEAQTAFDAWSEGASDMADVVVGGQVVGQRALMVDGSTTSVVWRNGTSVFILDGPADEVEQFYAYVGV